MALDPSYVIAPSLQEYFVDKDTGLPLSGGQVYFFKDGTNIPKPVYELSGNLLLGIPYTYTVLPNPVTLSAVGTFQDASGNDIIPYYLPFVSPTDRTIELYYIEVYDSMGVLQFTRSAWPNITSESITTSQDITNFVPNGQFLLHDNVPASSSNSFTAGKISADITTIAPGGWTFERGPTSTASDFVTFPSLTATTTPSGNAQYVVQIQTNTTGGTGDTRKDLCLNFPNVNTFASDTQAYNLYFEGQSTSGGSILCQMFLRKVYDPNNSSTITEDPITTITLSPGFFSTHNVEILFGTNIGKTIAPGSYVQIILRPPPTGSQTIQLTNFALTLNNNTLSAFPTQTEAQQLDPSTAGWFPVPDPNGNDLYCPAILGPKGLLFDHSQIGRIEGYMVPSGSQTGNLLFCDGLSYLSADYSALGIPYSRLKNVLFNTTLNGTLFGTGANFVNSYINSGTTAELILITNKLGLQTNPADTGATGFTFNPSTNAGTAGLGFTAYANLIGRVTAFCDVVGSVTSGILAGTSGFGVFDLKQSLPGVDYQFTLQPNAASTLVTGGAGLYFDFWNTTTAYRMWFNTGTEVAPAAGGKTLVQCRVVSTMAAREVGAMIAAVLTGYQTNTILVTGQPATAGSYFTFNANSTTYYVWYKINGSGTAPAQPFAQLIEVDLTGGETAAQVAFKTQTAINSQYFAVPDLRGYFLRGADIAGNVDYDYNLRYGYNFSTLVEPVGTYEWDSIIAHYHTTVSSATGGGATQGGSTGSAITGAYGFQETRPVNAAVNWFIRY